MGFLVFLIFGLIAGALAKLILPGKQGGGWITTLILGVVGALALAIPLFAGGSRDGMRTSTYSDGSPRERVAWVDGRRDGPCVRWNRDGSIRAEGVFADGKMVGEWTFFLPDGARDAERSGTYEAGRRTR